MNKTLCLMMIASAFLLSSCSALLRNREVLHHGTKQGDLELPVVVYPAAESFSKKIVFFLSGDGGWIDFDDELALEYQKDGFTVVGFNSRNYFWEQKTPEQTTADVVKLISKYSKMYRSNNIYLTGYSFGADVVPFIFNRLPADEKRKVNAIQLLSPFASTDFDIHLIDLVNLGGDNREYKVRPEIEKIRIPVFCFYGQDEDPKPLSDIIQKNVHVADVPGDHSYDPSAYSDIVSALRSRRSERK
jgi:type IV secretory pathway VirJ component